MTERSCNEARSAKRADWAVESRRSVLGRVLHAIAGFRALARAGRAIHVAVYSLTRGRLMGRWFGAPVLVLETRGRRSGKRRRATMTYCPLGRAWVVVPINAGSARTPAWWLNLRCAPDAIALVRGRRVGVRAHEARGPERDDLWERYVRQTPVLEEFRRYARREIPVVVLERRAASATAERRAASATAEGRTATAERREP
jgi:deazaflavin-dependent oxidoreductase (nitroreductase family)